jgi:S-adenosylmethionine:diacylglycerol 3-amino-3-carboxypropyl transferase
MKAASDRVVFGHMHEDHSVELSLVSRLPLKRALVIASGGDLAFALAGAKVAVTAVDSNHAQIDLVRVKMQCPANLTALCFSGRVDRLFRWGGPFLAWLFGWPEMRPGRIRILLADMLEGFLPQMVTFIHGARAGARLNRDAIRLIRRRLECAMRKPDAGNNPLLQVLLGNRFGPKAPEVWSQRGIEKWRGEIDRIELKAAGIAQVLRHAGDGSLGLISVSNLPDVMETDDWNLLVEDAGRALANGGYLVVRSMLSETLEWQYGDSFVTEENPLEDASPICPVVWIGRKC